MFQVSTPIGDKEIAIAFVGRLSKEFPRNVSNESFNCGARLYRKKRYEKEPWGLSKRKNKLNFIDPLLIWKLFLDLRVKG